MGESTQADDRQVTCARLGTHSALSGRAADRHARSHCYARHPIGVHTRSTIGIRRGSVTSGSDSLNEQIQNALRLLARDAGATPERVENSLLLAVANPPADWHRSQLSHALVRVLASAANEIEDSRLRKTAWASLNLDQSPRTGGLLARQKALASDLRRDPDTVRNWWRDEAVVRLAGKLAFTPRTNKCRDI